MRADLLHVVTAISNPILWASRIRLYSDFEQHMLDSGVKLTTVECTYGEHDPQIGANPHVNYVRVRASGVHKVWNKECLLNLGVAATPGAKYIATIDADVQFRSKDWARDTVHALQHYHVIQPWAYAHDLGPKGEHVNVEQSFCSLYYQKGAAGIHQGVNAKHKAYYKYGHTGYAWAYTRQALEWPGGLIETAALGSADHHMALALIGKVQDSIRSTNGSGGCTSASRATSATCRDRSSTSGTGPRFAAATTRAGTSWRATNSIPQTT